MANKNHNKITTLGSGKQDIKLKRREDRLHFGVICLVVKLEVRVLSSMGDEHFSVRTKVSHTFDVTSIAVCRLSRRVIWHPTALYPLAGFCHERYNMPKYTI